MILPKKHIKLNESILGLSGVFISKINKESTLDETINMFLLDQRIPKYVGIEETILVIDFLFMLGYIELDEEGKLKLCN